jgi:hypothetical protein
MTLRDASSRDTLHDFDFLFGRWTVANRRLADYFADEAKWQEFASTFETQPILGGAGNVDRIHVPNFPDRGDFHGFTLRLLEPETGRWRIWWASTSGGGLLDTPVIGRFEDGRGLFESDDVVEGHAVKVAYEWLDITDRSARWQQSFSEDGGRTFRTNWIMQLTREE